MPESAEPPSDTARPVAALVVGDVSRDLADDWDDAFAWSYGQRYWNIGCG